MSHSLIKQQKKLNPISISPGWSHILIGSSLSPRAKKQILSATQELELQSPKIMSSEQLFVPMIDLGICHRASIQALKLILQRTSAHHAAFKLFGDSFTFTALSESYAGSSYLISLSLKDRHDQFLFMKNELLAGVKRYGFECQQDLIEPTLKSQARLKKSTVELIIGSFEKSKDQLKHGFNGSIWVNDLILLSRPHDYKPSQGYQVEHEVKLLVEPPSPQDDLDRLTLKGDENRLDLLYQKLDVRLEERAQAYKDHTINRTTESISPEPKRRRRRRKRSKNS